MNEGGCIKGYSSIFKVKQALKCTGCKGTKFSIEYQVESVIPYQVFAQSPTLTKT